MIKISICVMSKKNDKKSRKASSNVIALAPVAKNFSARAALMKFSSSLNTGNIRDKKLTAEAIKDHSVEGKRLSVRKYIMQGEELNGVINAISSARIYFIRETLPWQDEGIRIVPAQKVVELKIAMEEKPWM